MRIFSTTQKRICNIDTFLLYISVSSVYTYIAGIFSSTQIRILTILIFYGLYFFVYTPLLQNISSCTIFLVWNSIGGSCSWIVMSVARLSFVIVYRLLVLKSMYSFLELWQLWNAAVFCSLCFLRDFAYREKLRQSWILWHFMGEVTADLTSVSRNSYMKRHYLKI